MNLRKPFKTTIVMILLGIDLLILSLFVSAKNTTSKDFLKSTVRDFNIVEYVKDKSFVLEHSKGYKYPLEVFNYINVYDFNSLMDKAIDNLYDQKKPIISNTEISNLLSKSVSVYDVNNRTDSMKFVKDDINRLSTEISYDLNGNVLMSIVRIILSLLYSVIYYIPFVLVILFFILIVIFEKRNGFLICGVTSFVYSFYLYFINTRLVKSVAARGGFFSYIENIDKMTLKLDLLYILFFIVSFIFLFTFIIMYLRKMVRDIRLKSYEGWR